MEQQFAMVLISYDISNNKLRTKFSKFLEKSGVRLQYSVFKIINSDRILNNIVCEIENNFGKKFGETDSVYIFILSATCEIKRFGYARHEEQDFLIV